MKIAATYENGEIFQHFGRTKEFKLYEIEDGKVISSQVISADGPGHEALAGFLANNEIGAVICGGLGGGMQAALSSAGIEVISGITGDADAAVEAYLKGELASSGVNCTCDHHHHEDHDEGEGCHCHDEGNDCHCHEAPVQGKNVSRTCRVHYRGTLNDGTQFDSSYDRGEPIEFICGAGMMIPGFDSAVAKMDVGQIVDVHLTAEEAYGEYMPERVFQVPVDRLPGSERLSVGQQVQLVNPMGQPFVATVAGKDDKIIVFDTNHPFAGKELNFRIELVEVK